MAARDDERVTFRIRREKREELDDLVDEEEFENRSEAVRAGVDALLRQHRIADAARRDQQLAEERGDAN